MLGLHHLFNSIVGGVNKKDLQGDTRLYRAARQGNKQEVIKLLAKGADPNIKNNRNLTALHQAAYWGETEIVELLLKAGAKADADNGKGWTPLHSAAVSGGKKLRKKIIDILVKAGANPDKQDKHGWTPADYMSLWENNAAAAEKLKAFLEIEDGRTPEQIRKSPRIDSGMKVPKTPRHAI